MSAKIYRTNNYGITTSNYGITNNLCNNYQINKNYATCDHDMEIIKLIYAILINYGII